MLPQRSAYIKKVIFPLLKAGMASILAVSMIIFPQQAFQAAFRGLDAWWSIVFPALLPFFVMSELLMGLGVVNFMGILLEPIMRPLFNVPGAGAFVAAMGYTSGAPIGTILTVELRKKNLCSRTEAQRLMSFTSNTSPLFLFGAVSVGMFHNVSLGLTLALSHYLANISIGLLLGLFSRRRTNNTIKSQPRPQKNLMVQACKALLEHQRLDNRPLGTLMADAVKKSAQTLSMIGGYIIFFSVLAETLKLLGLLNVLAGFLLFFLKPLGIDHSLGHAVATGFLEITLGAKLCSEANVNLPLQLLAVSAIMGWGGLSIHAQVASIIKETDIKIHTFILARCLHAALAPVFTLFLMKPTAPVFTSIAAIYQPVLGTKATIIGSFVMNLLTAMFAFIIVLLIIALAIFCLYLLKHLYRWYFYKKQL